MEVESSSLISRAPPLDRPMFDYQFLKSASMAFGERNDCSVVATCVVANESYSKIHQMYKVAGRRSRCGTHWPITVAVLAQLGLRLHECTNAYPGRTVRAVAPQLPEDRRFLVRSAKHVLGIVHAKAEDWSAQRGLYVMHVFEVLATMAHTPDQLIRQEPARGRWNGNASGLKVSDCISYAAHKLLDRYMVDFPNQPYPLTRQFWLAIRAQIMEYCEQNYGIKRTTCSVELGKWQTSIGYDMKRML